jgi:hypothetical protein
VSTRYIYSPHTISVASKNNMAKYGIGILILLCAGVSPAYAKNGGDPVNQLQKGQYEKKFDTELFAKCNACHKPFENTVVGSRTIPSYSSMSHMEQAAINAGIEHGGHLSSADKSNIYSVIHPVAETGNKTKKKKAAKKAHKPTKKHGKSKKKNKHVATSNFGDIHRTNLI